MSNQTEEERLFKVMQNLVSHSPLCGDDFLKGEAQGTSPVLSSATE